jgi:hypothetical protein
MLLTFENLSFNFFFLFQVLKFIHVRKYFAFGKFKLCLSILQWTKSNDMKVDTYH